MIGGWARVWLWAAIGVGLAFAPTFAYIAAYRTAAAAQIGAAALAGRIVDQKGGALPGTTVTVVSVATGLSRTVAAGTDGEYVIQTLPPGTYRLRAELSGFRPLVREGIRLATGETVAVDLQLELSGVTEAVTVVGAAPLLRTETASLGQVIDQEKIVGLPLNGRTFITLAGLAPGVALPPGSLLPRTGAARRAVAQALKFGAEIVTPQAVTGIRVDGPGRIVSLGDGSEVRGHAVLLGMGIEWRKLDVPGIEPLIGAGVYYGGTVAEALLCRNEDVYVVGGANSAGQAALSFSRYARKVTMLVRGDSLAASMSRYLIEHVEQAKNVEVRLRTTVVGVEGTTRLEAITIRDGATDETERRPTHALFVFIGGVPHTQCVEGLVQRDGHGFILTGGDLAGDGDASRGHAWPLEREPFWLESSVPGIFAAGDVRHGSVKRVAAGVGEGATAVQFVHQYLQSSVAAGPDDPTRLPDHRTPGPPDIRTMDTRDGPTRARVGAAGASEAERGR